MIPFLDIDSTKFLILIVLALIIIGPKRLPEYVAKARTWIRAMRDMAEGAKTQLKAEMGPDYEDIDWRQYDPRQYDPRKIVREALFDDPDADIAGTLGLRDLQNEMHTGATPASRVSADVGQAGSASGGSGVGAAVGAGAGAEIGAAGVGAEGSAATNMGANPQFGVGAEPQGIGAEGTSGAHQGGFGQGGFDQGGAFAGGARTGAMAAAGGVAAVGAGHAMAAGSPSAAGTASGTGAGVGAETDAWASPSYVAPSPRSYVNATYHPDRTTPFDNEAT